ncbi:hypothetical protein HPB50_025394 [Hyalomma asiaticum]|uniref:Uncharacterized protein n=1 Tax=Hyalomma asiaticum TaxID=266040 RepID=A0ACB7S2Y1_HYAAI|nr:hypothetical protein HPB50_025394 [Hyalomma asiaticum]
MPFSRGQLIGRRLQRRHSPEEECPRNGHVVYVQQICSVREDRINVEPLDVRHMSDGFVGQEELVDVDHTAVVAADFVDPRPDVVEVVAHVPIELR